MLHGQGNQVQLDTPIYLLRLAHPPAAAISLPPQAVVMVARWPAPHRQRITQRQLPLDLIAAARSVEQIQLLDSHIGALAVRQVGLERRLARLVAGVGAAGQRQQELPPLAVAFAVAGRPGIDHLAAPFPACRR